MADPTYDFTPDGEAKDDVRLLIADVGGEDGTKFIFSDEEINRFLSMRSGSVFRASATALRTIAGNRVQVAQRILYLGLQTDGPKESTELRKLAGELEDQADSAASESGFEIADIARSEFGGP